MSNAKLHSFNPSYVYIYRIRKERECLPFSYSNHVETFFTLLHDDDANHRFVGLHYSVFL